jgi:hypothetical protein
VPPPDLIAKLLSEAKRYRLVIGASAVEGELQSDQEYIEETAKLVDAQLASLGYAPVSALKNGPYLVGGNASRTALEDAIKLMADEVQANQIGVIYYVGHGTLTSGNKDLTLAVSGQPLGSESGIHVSSLIGWLTVHAAPSNTLEIPHYIIILDSCYSGNIASEAVDRLLLENGVPMVVQVPANLPTTERIAILTATDKGDNKLSFQLGGTKLSALGYYLTEALDRNWACANRFARDGILTLDELQLYLDDQLAMARKAGAVGEMHPQIPRNDRRYMFLEYRSDQVSVVESLARRRIVTLYAAPGSQTTAQIRFPSGLDYSCSPSNPKGCSVPFSKSYPGKLTVVAETTRLQNDWWAFWRPVVDFINGLREAREKADENKGRTPGPTIGGGTDGGKPQSGTKTQKTATRTRSGSIKLSSLVKHRRARVAGVLLEIK